MKEEKEFFLKIVDDEEVGDDRCWCGPAIFDPFEEDDDGGTHLNYVVNYCREEDGEDKIIITNVYTGDMSIELESDFMEPNPSSRRHATVLYFESEYKGGPAFRINIQQHKGATLTEVLQGWGKSGLKSRLRLEEENRRLEPYP